MQDDYLTGANASTFSSSSKYNNRNTNTRRPQTAQQHQQSYPQSNLSYGRTSQNTSGPNSSRDSGQTGGYQRHDKEPKSHQVHHQGEIEFHHSTSGGDEYSNAPRRHTVLPPRFARQKGGGPAPETDSGEYNRRGGSGGGPDGRSDHKYNSSNNYHGSNQDGATPLHENNYNRNRGGMTAGTGSGGGGGGRDRYNAANSLGTNNNSNNSQGYHNRDNTSYHQQNQHNLYSDPMRGEERIKSRPYNPNQSQGQGKRFDADPDGSCSNVEARNSKDENSTYSAPSPSQIKTTNNNSSNRRGGNEFDSGKNFGGGSGYQGRNYQQENQNQGGDGGYQPRSNQRSQGHGKGNSFQQSRPNSYGQGDGPRGMDHPYHHHHHQHHPQHHHHHQPQHPSSKPRSGGQVS